MKHRYSFMKKCKIFFKGFGRYFVLIGILGIITSSMSFIEPILDANIVTNLTSLNIEKAIQLALILVLLRLFMQILYYASNMLFSTVKFRCILDIRMRVCDAYLKIKSKVLDQNESGLFIERIKNDPADITELFTSIQDYLIGIITNLGIIFYVYWIHPLIGFLYTISILILFLIQKYRISVIVRRRQENKVIREENTTLLNNLIQGTKDIKLLNLKSTFMNHIEKTFEKNFHKRLDTNREVYLFWAFYYCTRETLCFLILLLGGYLVAKGELSVTNLLILWMYRSNINSFVVNVSNMAEKLSTFNVYAERIIELLDSEVFEQEEYGMKNPNTLTGNIRFDNVSFAYQEQPILKNINFEIKANETVAFVGKSGAGKTTIFGLLSKLYDVEGGNVYLDQYDINELSEKTIRNHIAVISQNPYLFHLSIKENLLLSNPKLKIREMKEICKLVCLDELIESLPEQYDTVIGEGGVNLSGGERQRLAIARALIKNTPIILLDEATSALDNTTQMHIQQTLKNIGKNKTIVIIAHRLSTILECDKIYVLDKGKIVASGKHQELLDTCKIYRDLYAQEK